MSAPLRNRINWILPLALLAAVLALSLWAMTREWDKPLLDMHSFRQTQTAISSYYMTEDSGMFFNYITPVLGKPWQAPIEAPIYQWIVARWHNIIGMGLDQSGKLVSIVFWFACIWPVWRLLMLLGFSLPQRCIVGTLLYASPLYLYWSRAFMMETTGQFLSLGMVACIVAGYKLRNRQWLLAAFVFGLGAALCKISTWAIAVGVAGLLILFLEGLPKWRDWRWIVGSGIVAVLPILPGKFWLNYGDAIKMKNPFVRELFVMSSPSLHRWLYGTLEQKLDPATWLHIWRHITDQLLVPFPLIGPFLMPLILVAGAIASPKRIPLILIFLAGFASGPLIFTNLYFEHSYYWCANGIWLLLAVGVALAGISEFKPEQHWPKITAITLAAAIAVSGFTTWFRNYLPILKSLPTYEQLAEVWIKPVQKVVPPERTLLIVGNDWNPNSLYYAERKGIAFPTAAWIPFPGPQLTESLAMLGPKEKLGAVVIAESLLTPQNQAGLVGILQQLGMSMNGTRTAFGFMFPALDLKPETPSQP